jgi:hypothetical protein
LSFHNRLVLPQSLQSKAIELAHAGHQGIVKTKMLLREKVWFPQIDKIFEEKVKRCLSCQAATKGTQPSPEPLIMTSLPHAPWQEVAADFVGLFPSGELLLVVVDEISRFPEVEIVTTTSARAVIPKLDNIFSRQGVPVVLKLITVRHSTAPNLNNSPDILDSNIVKLLPTGHGQTARQNISCVRFKQAIYQFL